jgi:2',3'-cyclic-nucleotide 2'-phosphodiesterase (5'-nucleotidase family)
LNFKHTYIYVLILTLIVACGHRYVLKSVEPSSVELNAKDNPPVDSTVWKIIAPYKTEMDKKMNEVLIVSNQPLVKGEPEGALGNLVADITLSMANKKYTNGAVDFCVLNNGGLRSALPKGEITMGKVFELMPFENEMVVLTLSGDKVKKLLAFIAERNGCPLSGIKLGIKNNLPINVLINNVSFDENKTYKLVTSDYLANGGDKLEFLTQGVAKELLNYKLRDAIIDYLKAEKAKGNTLTVKTDGRIYNE